MGPFQIIIAAVYLEKKENLELNKVQTTKNRAATPVLHCPSCINVDLMHPVQWK